MLRPEPRTDSAAAGTWGGAATAAAPAAGPRGAAAAAERGLEEATAAEAPRGSSTLLYAPSKITNSCRGKRCSNADATC